MTNVLKIEPGQPDSQWLDQTVELLRAGQCIVYPTDTVYGLGADAVNPEAVRRLLAIKGRSEANPVPLLIGQPQQLAFLTERLSVTAGRLIDRFWPGALTLVLKAKPGWEHVASPQGELGVRLPDHQVPRLLCEKLGGPIIGTSANKTGQPASLSAEQALDQLGDQVALILDCGPGKSSDGSTVLKVGESVLKILRQGDLPAVRLAQELPGICIVAINK